MYYSALWMTYLILNKLEVVEIHLNLHNYYDNCQDKAASAYRNCFMTRAYVCDDN